MKKLFSFVFILSILLSSMGSSIIYLHYLTNRAYYANVLCENKAKPMLHCNGHCMLKKELNQQEKKEQGTPLGSVKDKTELVYFYQSPVVDGFSTPQITLNFLPFEELLTSDYHSSIFRPPSC